uniref:Uncharacterized protein n=1 Tax=Parascaris univalens TaxID=6257 RepID=A0A915ALG3_PARUN
RERFEEKRSIMFPPPPWKKKATYAQSCRLKRPIIRGRIVTREIVEEELKADRGETSSSGEDSLRAEREAETEKLAIERRRLLEYRAAQREMQSKFQEVFPDFNMVTHKAPSLNLSVASSELDPSSDDSSILSSLCSSHAEKELTKVSIMTPVAETENEQEDYSTDYSADEEISSIPNAVSFSNDMERSERSSQQESDRVEAGSDTETEDVVTPKIDRSSEIPMEIDETQDLAPEPTHPETTPLQTAPSNCVALKTAMRIGNLEVQNCQEVALPSSMVIIQNPETATSHVRIHMDKTPRCDATVGPEHCDSHQTGDSWSKVVESIVDSNVKCKEKGFEHPASEDAATAADVDEDNIKRPSDENVLTETNIAQGREPSGTLETKNQSSTSGSDSFRSEENFDFATKNLESATSKGGADHKRIAPCANDETELSKTFIVEGRCDSDPPAPSRSFLVEGPPQERLKSSSTQSLGSEVVARPATLTVTFDVSSIHAQTATAKTLIQIDESGPDAPRELKTVLPIKASQRGGVQRMRSIPEEGKSSAVRNRRRSTSLGPATSTPKIGETHTCSRYATHQAAYLLRKTSSISSEPVTPKVIARKSLADHSQSYKRGGEKMKCLVEQSQALSVIAKEYKSPASVPRNVHRTLSESGEFSIPSMPSTSRSSPVDRNPRKSPLPAAVNSRIPRPLSLLSVEGGSASVAGEHSVRPTTPDLSDGDTRMIVREAKSGPIPRRGVALYLKGPEHARTRLRFEKEHCSHTSLPTEQSENADEDEVEENGTMATPLEAHWQIAEVRRSRSYNSDVISTPLKHSDVGQSGEDKAKDNDDSGENHQKTLVSPTRDSAECNATILEEPIFDETVASTNTPNECSRTRLVFDTTFGSTFTSTDYTNVNANFSSSLMPVTATNNEKPVVVLKKPEIVHPTPVAEASGLRRSSRNRVARLRHWLGERPEYRFNEEGNCELIGISTVKIRDRFLIENGTSSPRVALERAKQIKKSNVNRKLHRVGAKERKRQLI